MFLKLPIVLALAASVSVAYRFDARDIIDDDSLSGRGLVDDNLLDSSHFKARDIDDYYHALQGRSFLDDDDDHLNLLDAREALMPGSSSSYEDLLYARALLEDVILSKRGYSSLAKNVQSAEGAKTGQERREKEGLPPSPMYSQATKDFNRSLKSDYGTPSGRLNAGSKKPTSHPKGEPGHSGGHENPGPKSGDLKKSY